MADEDGDFFSRWSRRKRAAVTETEPEAEAVTTEPELEPETEEDEAALLEKLGLPAPETLGEGDDFSRFMADGVPRFLRKRALRVLWRSNPVLANLDGLNDYDDDFTSPELTQKVLATGYQVGRGFVKKVVEASADDEAPQPVAPEDVADATSGEAPEINDVSEIDTAESQEISEEPAPTPRPRRMRFET